MRTLAPYAPPGHGFRTFLVLWATQSLSVIGSGMTGFALNVYLAQTLYPDAHQKAELAFAFTALNLASAIPFIFGGPIAGAWTDRLDRRMILLVANAASAMLTLAILVLLIVGALNVWVLVATGILGSAVGAFHFAAFDASYAMPVPDRLLARANGMMWTTWSLAGIVSPALAAFILAWPALGRQAIAPFGPLAGMTDATLLVIGIDTVTFVIAAVALLFVHVPSPVRTDLAVTGVEKPSLWADVREGVVFICDRPVLLWLLGTFTVANLAVAPAGVLVPLLVKFNLAADWQAQGYTFDTALALLGVTAGIGGLIGGLLISTWGGLEQRRIYGVIIPMLLGGIAQVAYGFSPLLLLCAGAAFIKAFMEPIFNAHSQAIWQSITPRGGTARGLCRGDNQRRAKARAYWATAVQEEASFGTFLRYGLVVDVTAPGRALFAPVLLLSKVGETKNKTRHRAATQTITGINAQISSSVPRGGIRLPFGR